MSHEEKEGYLAKYPDVTVLESLFSHLIELGPMDDPSRELVVALRAKGLLQQPPLKIKAKFPDLF
ncbi:hypothetical protein [Parachlamydia sp. AcF125]|uniref:hypothetical protein n=1 Tax=Parachlamydia sp. AcF125 TaxID=2795736 RepID=UPI001BC947D6|nr:hypothetical protein [Parachlamydia sp. AcF125]MBS4169136.1 hypothetical protein [Parachlamydia sp. AcF125]